MFNVPTKLVWLFPLGRAPVLVPLRPSSEHILIVRAPGARDQHGRHSVSSCAFCEQEGWSGCSPPTLLRPRVARAQGTHRAIPPLLADFFSILLEPDRHPCFYSALARIGWKMGSASSTAFNDSAPMKNCQMSGVCPGISANHRLASVSSSKSARLSRSGVNSKL